MAIAAVETRGVAVAPADSDLATMLTELYVGYTGDMKLTLESGDVITLYAVNGWIKGKVVKRVWATGTTASGIVGWY